MDCVQPIPRPELSETIAEIIINHFGIQDEKGKGELKLLLDLYVDLKTMERVRKAFCDPKCEMYGGK